MVSPYTHRAMTELPGLQPRRWAPGASARVLQGARTDRTSPGDASPRARPGPSTRAGGAER